MKFLLWALIIVAVVLFVLHAKRRAAAGRRQGRAGGDAEEMVRCEQCGLYLPRSEAISNGAGRSYCSDEHRRLDEHA